MKKLLVAGGTGFLGQSLEAYFQQRGDQVTILTRNPRAENHRRWNGQDLGAWTAGIEEADVVINLTGKSVDCRYTEANRAEILRSRVASTQVLGQAIVAANRPPAVWLNASSATIYVPADQQRITEATGIIGNDFSMSVCQAWEETFFIFDLPQTRQVALRTSIALGKGGGAFPKMKTITRLGLGGQQGSGEQWMSWILYHRLLPGDSAYHPARRYQETNQRNCPLSDAQPALYASPAVGAECAAWDTPAGSPAGTGSLAAGHRDRTAA